MAMTADDKKMLRKYVTTEEQSAESRLHEREQAAMAAAHNPTTFDGVRSRKALSGLKRAAGILNTHLAELHALGYTATQPGSSYRNDVYPVRGVELKLIEKTVKERQEVARATFQNLKDQVAEKARTAQLEIISTDLPATLTTRLAQLRAQLSAISESNHPRK